MIDHQTIFWSPSVFAYYSMHQACLISKNKQFRFLDFWGDVSTMKVVQCLNQTKNYLENLKLNFFQRTIYIPKNVVDTRLNDRSNVIDQDLTNHQMKNMSTSRYFLIQNDVQMKKIFIFFWKYRKKNFILRIWCSVSGY